MSEIVDFEKLAEEYKLTKLQKLFAEYYVYVTGLDGPAAIELAGYKVDKSELEGYSPEMKEIFTKKATSTKARELLNNPKVLKYIGELRKDLERHLIIDKLWVINKLKDLAVRGCENTQLKATELLGKHLEMFTEKTKIEGMEDPGDIAQKAYERRINTINFSKKQQNE